MWLASADTLPAPAPAFGLGAGAYLQTTIALLLTCLAAVIVLRLLRGARPVVHGQALQIVSQLPLSGAHTIYLVRAADRYLLLGGAPGGLTLLLEMEKGQVDQVLEREDAMRQAPAWRRLLARRERS